MERRASASRRIANVLLSVVLVLGLLPTPAFAGDGANDAADPAVTATQGGQGDSSAAQQDAATIGADDSNGGESLPEAGDVFASMKPDTTAEALDIDSALMSDRVSALSEGGASLTPGWTQSGTCEWKIDATGLLTVRPLGNGASGELAGRGHPWLSQSSSIKSAVIEPGVSAKTCSAMFYGCSSLATLDLSGLDTSAVTDMTAMFYGCSKLSSLDLSSFDTGSVTAMGYCNFNAFDTRGMFEGCSSLKVLDLSSFDTSKVTEMGGMFRDCSSLASLDLSSFDTSAVTGMYGMFEGCSSLASLDLSGLDTSKVTRMDYMFRDCKSLEFLDLSGLDTSAVTGMIQMFLGCSSLTTLDLSSFDTSKLTDMNYMFYGCSSLATLDLSSFDFGKVVCFDNFAPDDKPVTVRDAESYRILANEASMRNITVKDVAPSDETWSVWNTCEWKVSNGTLVIRPAGGAASGMLGYPFQQSDKYVNGGYIYYYAPWHQQRKTIKSVIIEPGIAACGSVSNLFNNHANLTSADLSGLDFSTVKDMSRMFYGCSSLKEIPTGFEIPANVSVSQCFYVPDSTEMRYAGTDAAITTYDWASDNRVLAPAAAEGWSRFGGVQWQVANGTLTIAPLPGENGGEMGSLGVYAGAPWYAQRKDITSIKIEGDIKAGASLGYAFDGMANLVSADLSNLDVSATTDMSCMFRGCSSLASVDLSSWVTPSLENACMAFSKCASLQSADLIGWDFSHVTDMRQMFAYCPELAEVPSGLTIPAGADSSKLFYVGQKAPIDYNGSDKSLMAYDWKSDNRIAEWACAGEHSWGNGVVTKKPTCTEPGEETLTCTVCGATLVGSPVAAKGHHFDGMTCPDCGTHLGDVNGNGVVNVVDAQVAYDIATILGMYADMPGYKAYRGAADVTGPGGAPDGIVDAVDAFRIQYAALHGWE